MIINLWSVQMNASEWKDPGLFNPDRFLDTDGKLINKERLVVFSMGNSTYKQTDIHLNQALKAFFQAMAKFDHLFIASTREKSLFGRASRPSGAVSLLRLHPPEVHSQSS